MDRRPGPRATPARARRRSDFDRGARQQRVLLSLREQADPQELIPQLPELIDALKQTVRTDIPIAQLDELLGLASSDRHEEHPLVRVLAAALPARVPCADPRGYMVLPNVDRSGPPSRTPSRPTRPTRPRARSSPSEGGPGLGAQQHRRPNRGARLAGYLEYYGLAASAPRQTPDRRRPGGTRRSSSTTAPRPA